MDTRAFAFGAKRLGLGITSARGIAIRSYGVLLLDAVDRPLKGDFYLRHGLSTKVWVTDLDVLAGQTFEQPLSDGTQYTQAALIAEDKLNEAPPSQFTIAMLVYVYAEENFVLYARRSTRKGVYLPDNASFGSPSFQPPSHAVLNVEGNIIMMMSTGYDPPVVECKQLSDDQKWCID